MVRPLASLSSVERYANTPRRARLQVRARAQSRALAADPIASGRLR